MDERIEAFLDYTTHAENFEGEELFNMKELAWDEAKELRKKKSYLKAFSERTVDGRSRSILNSAIRQRLKLLPRLLLDLLEVEPSYTKNDSVGRASIHYVCEAGDMELLKEFIRKKYFKVDFNLRDRAGIMPLHLAILYDQSKIAYKMLKRLAEVENYDTFFGRSIHGAAYMDQISVVKRIHERFPQQVTIVTSGFCTASVCALFGDSTECMEYIWKVSPLMADRILSKVLYFTESQGTALHRVTFLLDNKADPDGFDEELCEEPAVVVAAKKRWTEVVDVLVPRTKAIYDIEWTTQGVLDYVETTAFKQMDAQRSLNKVKTLKGRLIQELSNRNVLAAMIICVLLKSDVSEIMYERLQNLCKLYWELAISSSVMMEASVEKLRSCAMSLYRNASYELAMLATDGCFALDPNDAACLHIRQEIVKRMAERDELARKMADQFL